MKYFHSGEEMERGGKGDLELGLGVIISTYQVGVLTLPKVLNIEGGIINSVCVRFIGNLGRFGMCPRKCEIHLW